MGFYFVRGIVVWGFTLFAGMLTVVLPALAF